MNRVPKVTGEMNLLEKQANSMTRQYSVSSPKSFQVESSKHMTSSAGTI
jgi:hypothetical protein